MSSLVYFSWILFFSWYKIWCSRNKFSSQLQDGKSPVLLHLILGETSNHIPAMGLLVIHEYMICLPCSAILCLYLYPRISKYKTLPYEQKNLNETSWHILFLWVLIKSHKFYHTVNGLIYNRASNRLPDINIFIAFQLGLTCYLERK